MHQKLHSRKNCQFSLQESSEMSLSIIGIWGNFFPSGRKNPRKWERNWVLNE